MLINVLCENGCSAMNVRVDHNSLEQQRFFELIDELNVNLHCYYAKFVISRKHSSAMLLNIPCTHAAELREFFSEVVQKKYKGMIYCNYDLEENYYQATIQLGV